MEKNDKYPGAVIESLAHLFAQKDSNSPTYFSGRSLVSLFNDLGFPDTYQFSGGGICTPDGIGLSRTQYSLKRLSDINNAFRLPEALNKFIEATGWATEPMKQIDAIFGHYRIENPIANLTAPSLGSVSPAFKAERIPMDDNINSVVTQAESSLRNEAIPTSPTKSTGSKPYDEVFDEIPTGCKIAFISYSWDDDAHKDWVRKLAEDITRKGIYPLLDQYLPAGYPLIHFMNKGMEIADKVVVVGTPKYREKSILVSSGGAQYEESIIHTELMRNISSTKFVPITRSGRFDEALPPLLSSRNGFDFSKDEEYDVKLQELVRSLHAVPKYARITLGPVPTFGYEDLSKEEKEALKSPSSDFRKDQDRKWLERLLGNFSFDLMHEYVCGGPDNIDIRVFISLDIWTGLISKPTFQIFDPKLRDMILSLHKIWHEAERTGMKHYSTIPNSNRAKFYGLQSDTFVSDEAERDFNKIVEAQLKMQPLLAKLATYIQDNFEIDVEETSEAFLRSLKH